MSRSSKKRNKPSGSTTSGTPEVAAKRLGTPWRGALAAAAILALAALAAWCNSFSGVYIFDDDAWIVQNQSIRRLWPIWPVLFPQQAALVGGRPVVSLTLAVNYALGGMNVWGYHAVNLAIHILAAWTLFGIVRRTLKGPWPTCRRPLNEKDSGCLAAAGTTAQPYALAGEAPTLLAIAVSLLWMLHPLQTESVSYIIQRTEALMGLFYLLTLYCVIRGATSNKPIVWYAAATASCALGMATKEVTATAPLIVLLYDRTFIAGSFREAWRRRYGLYLALASTWTIIVLLLLFTGFYGGTTGFAVEKFTPWSYLMTQAPVLVRYLRLTFCPTGLCLDYGWPPVQSISEVVLPGLLIVALLALTIWALVKRPAWGFLGAWFFVILAPTSSVIPIKDAAYEHRMYLPLAALASAVVMGGFLAGRKLVQRNMLSPKAASIAAVSLTATAVVLLGVLTFQRNTVYRSGFTIWQDTVAKAPHNHRAHNNLGKEYIGLGRSEEAIRQYKRSLEIEPKSAEAHSNLSMALIGIGQIDEAIVHGRRALDIRPVYADANVNLGLALSCSKRFDEAIVHYKKALEINPYHPQAHNNLGTQYLRIGEIDQAIAHYQKALENKPDFPMALKNLGGVLADRGQIAEAVLHFQRALELKPDYAEVREILGRALAYREHILKMLADLRAKNRAHPNDIALLNNLAWPLATHPDLAVRSASEAMGLAQKAVEISGGRNAEVLDTLGAAYAEAGRFPEAVEIAQRAVNIAIEQNKPELAKAVNIRIQLYKTNRPYRELPPFAPKQP
jgi:protein O-mannosyl-transferase